MLITIRGSNIASPDTYNVSIQDLDASASRSGNGTLYRDRIAVKRSIELGWTILTGDEIKTILNSVSGVFFSVTYLDPQTGGMRTGTFYTSDRKTGVAIKQHNGKYLWKGVSLTLTER